MACGVHCDAWGILTKGGIESEIGIRGFSREKGVVVGAGVKIKLSMRHSNSA